MRRRDDHGQQGQATLMIVGFAFVLAMAVALVVDASAAYLQRQGLDTVADGAALRGADAIVQEEIRAAGLYQSIWQAFAVLLPVRSVGVMGDDRTYEEACAIRAVTSSDGMTGDWARIPHDVLAKMSTRIINEVRGINRVAYDISSKPPATIEWE